MRPPGVAGAAFSRAADASARATKISKDLEESFELLPKIFSSRAAEPSGVAHERTRYRGVYRAYLRVRQRSENVRIFGRPAELGAESAPVHIGARRNLGAWRWHLTVTFRGEYYIGRPGATGMQAVAWDASA